MKDEINNLQEYPLVTCLCSALVTYIPATNETYFQKNTCIGIEKNCYCGYGGQQATFYTFFHDFWLCDMSESGIIGMDLALI